MIRWLVVLFAFASIAAASPLLVISVDGLDQRYLTDRQKLGLKIPNIVRLMEKGQWSAGVIGEVPTVTWPSHTTLITGVPPAQHGILGNRRPASEGGDYYWTADLIKVPTLLQAAHQAGRKIATITWPVTVDAAVDFNLPEYFQRRRGGAMDLRSIESKSRPSGLVPRIIARYPSFAQEWMDDRTRTLAARYLLEVEKPDLLLIHLVDLDSEAHDNAPFSREALAMLEYTDELIGSMIQAASGYAVAVVSDHGFERVQTEVNLKVLSAEMNVATLRPMGGIVVAEDLASAGFLADLAKEPKYGIGRRIPAEELARYNPRLSSAQAVYESAEGFWFGNAEKGSLFTKPHEIGNHGHWPTRYRAVFLLTGPGIGAERLPEISQTSIRARLSAVVGLPD